jgi:hypothetical protein
MMIVTYPTALHESFNTLLSAFSYISHTSDSFVFDTGVELLVTEKDGLRPRVPDLVFGKKSDGPGAVAEYGIVVECGYSQSAPSLDTKATTWFTVSTVQTAITINFDCNTFSNPQGVIPPDRAVDLATFSKNSVPSLGDIKYEGHVWAPAITAITMDIYVRNPNTQVRLNYVYLATH